MGESDATQMVVVRHGETVWNTAGRQQGQLDSELSPTGVRQAEAIAEALADQTFHTLYTSDLARAVQTAEIIGRRLGIEPIPEPGLRERHLGILQGLTMAQFAERFPAEHALLRSDDPDYAIPEGESVRERQERHVCCAEALAERHAGQRLLLVAHGGVLNSLFRHALGLPLASPRAFSLLNASLNRFSVSAGRWRLETWGETGHLAHLRAMDDW